MSEIYQDGFSQGQYEYRSQLRHHLESELHRIITIAQYGKYDKQELYTLRAMHSVIVNLGRAMGITDLAGTYPMVEVKR